MPWYPSHHDRQVSLLVDPHGCSSYQGYRWGIGRTEVPKSKTARGIPEWASAVEEVLDLLHINQCSVMAHSAGAPYALSFANKVPERIRGEILLLAPWVGGVEGGLCFLLESPNISSHPHLISWLQVAQVCPNRYTKDCPGSRVENPGLDAWQTSNSCLQRYWLRRQVCDANAT
jgi:pimeloyl-ACP methyl ester carboxylesterase